jgi:hypothetical protein
MHGNLTPSTIRFFTFIAAPMSWPVILATRRTDQFQNWDTLAVAAAGARGTPLRIRHDGGLKIDFSSRP